MLLAIEGIDGCGKGTQANHICDKAKAAGLSAAMFSFPRYGNNAYALAVARYLNGEFGGVNDVRPEFAALLFAGDRLAARDELEHAIETHDLVICDRYVPSNIAHQAAKLDPAYRYSFMTWLSGIEYVIHRVPKADMCIWLDVPLATAIDLVKLKKQRDYTSLKADIHEADTLYLRECAEVYRQQCENDPSNWVVVSCTDSQGHLAPANEITRTIWAELVNRFPSLCPVSTT